MPQFRSQIARHHFQTKIAVDDVSTVKRMASMWTVISLLAVFATTALHVASLHVSIETWRMVPHSYSIVGQEIALHLTRLARDSTGDFRGALVTIHEAPRYLSRWKNISHLREDTAERELLAIPVTAPQSCPDVVFRAYFPLNLAPWPGSLPSNSPLQLTCRPVVLTFGTTEYMTVIPEMIANARFGLASLADSASARVFVVPPSHWAAHGFLSSGVPPRKLWMLPHGVNTALFRPLLDTTRHQLRQEQGWNDDTLVLANIGAMTANKGISALLSTLQSTCSDMVGPASWVRDIVLVLKGHDELYASESFVNEALNGTAWSHCPHVKIVYIGSVLSTPAVAQLLQTVDVYVAPYLGEGFNLPVLESVACGTAVIVTDGGPTDQFTTADCAKRIQSVAGPIQFMGRYRGTCLVPNVSSLSSHLLEVSRNRTWLQAARQIAPNIIHSRYSWEVVCSELAQRMLSYLHILSDDIKMILKREVLFSVMGSAILHDIPVGFAPHFPKNGSAIGSGSSVHFSLLINSSSSIYDRGAIHACASVVQSFPVSARWTLDGDVMAPVCFNLSLPHSQMFRLQTAVTALPMGCHRILIGITVPVGVDVGSEGTTVTAQQHSRFCSDAVCTIHLVLDVVTVDRLLGSIIPTVAMSIVEGVAGDEQAGIEIADGYSAATALLESGLSSVGAYVGGITLLTGSLRSTVRTALALLTWLPPVPSTTLDHFDAAHTQAVVVDMQRRIIASGPSLSAIIRANPALSRSPMTIVPTTAMRFLGFPSPMLAYGHTDPSGVLASAALLYGSMFPQLTTFVAPHLLTKRPNQRSSVRVGFASSSFYNHALSRALVGTILTLVQDDRFQVIVFREERAEDASDPVASALKSNPGLRWVEFAPTSIERADWIDVQAAIAKERLDVIVFGDIGIHSLFYFLAFSRLATVQCAFWGSPLSTQLPSIDYFLTGEDFADAAGTKTPLVEAFSEQLVQLSGLGTTLLRAKFPEGLSATALQHKTHTIRVQLLERYGIPANRTVLFCPQTLAKVHPEFDGVVDRILGRLPDAVFILLEGTGPVWAAALRQRLSRTMLHHTRVHLLPRLSGEDYTAMLGIARVVLDTIPYSGFTTTLESLLLGTPVVTLCGSTLRSRQTCGLYTRLHFSRCISDSVDEYVDRAVRMVQDPDVYSAAVAGLAAAWAHEAGSMFKDTAAVDSWKRFLVRAVSAMD